MFIMIIPEMYLIFDLISDLIFFNLILKVFLFNQMLSLLTFQKIWEQQ